MEREGASLREKLQKQFWKGKDNMKKKLREFTVIALSLMLMTPVFTTPKLPTIPNLTGSVKLSEGVQKSIRDYVKNLNFKFNFN
jgi:hypothetical protein